MRNSVPASHCLLVSFFACIAMPQAAFLYGASLDALSLVYLPALHSPGEELVARAILVPEGLEKPVEFRLRPGSGLPDQSEDADPELRELSLSRTAAGWQLSLRFVPWSPGASSVPAMRLKGLSIPSIPYSATAALGPEDRDPSPPRPQRDLPGTVFYLYGLAGILIALVLGALAAAAYLVPAARSLLARRRAAQAFRRFAANLDYLAAQAESAEPAAFLAALSRAFRLYLSARALPSASALTAAEMDALPDTAFPDPGTKGKAVAFFAYSDRIRYRGIDRGDAIDSAALESAIDEARSIAEANEEALLARL